MAAGLAGAALCGGAQAAAGAGATAPSAASAASAASAPSAAAAPAGAGSAATPAPTYEERVRRCQAHPVRAVRDECLKQVRKDFGRP